MLMKAYIGLMFVLYIFQSDIKLCHLQLEQIKSELQTCQEQQRVHTMNVGDHFSPKTGFLEKDMKGVLPINSPKPQDLHQVQGDNLKETQGLYQPYHVSIFL